MKKKVMVASAVMIATFVITWYSCTNDSKETCQQDEICTAKFVTSCCTDSACVWKYNGQEYAENEINQLEKDLGCGSVGINLKSAGDQNSIVTEQLKALMDRTRARFQSVE